MEKTFMKDATFLSQLHTNQLRKLLIHNLYSCVLIIFHPSLTKLDYTLDK